MTSTSTSLLALSSLHKVSGTGPFSIIFCRVMVVCRLLVCRRRLQGRAKTKLHGDSSVMGASEFVLPTYLLQRRRVPLLIRFGG
ncbi:hypothetical protein LINPERHAP1_LOCUS34778 [Linum perenne]